MSEQAPASAQPVTGFLNRRGILLLTSILGLLAVLLGMAYAYSERQTVRAMRIEQLEQQSRLLERLTTNELASLELAFGALSEALLAKRPAIHLERLDQLLADNVRVRPLLRSLSVIDGKGNVLASSNPRNLNERIAPALLDKSPAEGGVPVFGGLLHGRDLWDLHNGASGAAGPTVLLLQWRVAANAGAPLVLVALINPDYLGTQYELMLNDGSLSAVLTDYRGTVLLSTSNGARLPGEDVRTLPVFRDLLPQQEAGQYIGPGVESPHAITAFRATRRWPLVLLVEQDYRNAMAKFWILAAYIVAAVGLVWFVLTAFTVFALRSLQRQAVTAAQLKKATDAFFASKAHAMAVLKSNLDAVVTVDAQGRIVAFNPAAERMFERQEADVMDQPMHELLVLPEHGHIYVDEIRRYLGSGASAMLHRRIKHVAMRADGSAFPVELSVVPVHIGRDVFFTATLRDITEQQRIEHEKRGLLKRYQDLASYLKQQKMALDEHAIVNIEDKSGYIIYANDKLVEISGYSREELLGKSELVLSKQLTPANYAAMRRDLAAGKAWHRQLARRRRDGTTYWVSSTTVAVADDKGEVCQYITVQTDITRQRQAEEALRQASLRELETGNRIQQSLLASAPAPNSPDVWLSFHNQPSQGIDGDFVDVIRIGPHCIDIITGDVMGKGVPAALMGAATKLQFNRSVAELLAEQGGRGAPPEPSVIVASVHKAMTRHLQRLESFVTLTYLRIDIRRNLLTWVGCGHEESLLMRGRGGAMLLPNQHPPLGILSDDAFAQDQTAFDAGDALFLCSDGLADAVDSSGERIGRNAVNAEIQRYFTAGLPPSGMLQLMRRNLLDPSCRIVDDVTMVLIKRPADPLAVARCELPVSLDSLQPLRDFVAQRLQLLRMDEEAAALLLVASVEVFTNVIRHGGGIPHHAPVEALAYTRDGDFVLDIMHLGDAFTPDMASADIALDDFPEGGFGLGIIHGACDRVDYLHEGGLNTVRMRRRLGIEAHLLQS